MKDSVKIAQLIVLSAIFISSCIVAMEGETHTDILKRVTTFTGGDSLVNIYKKGYDFLNQAKKAIENYAGEEDKISLNFAMSDLASGDKQFNYILKKAPTFAFFGLNDLQLDALDKLLGLAKKGKMEIKELENKIKSLQSQ
jgi:hypothetical protein